MPMKRRRLSVVRRASLAATRAARHSHLGVSGGVAAGPLLPAPSYGSVREGGTGGLTEVRVRGVAPAASPSPEVARRAAVPEVAVTLAGMAEVAGGGDSRPAECVECGASGHPLGARFCHGCGRPLGARVSRAEVAAASSHPHLPGARSPSHALPQQTRIRRFLQLRCLSVPHAPTASRTLSTWGRTRMIFLATTTSSMTRRGAATATARFRIAMRSRHDARRAAEPSSHRSLLGSYLGTYLCTRRAAHTSSRCWPTSHCHQRTGGRCQTRCRDPPTVSCAAILCCALVNVIVYVLLYQCMYCNTCTTVVYVLVYVLHTSHVVKMRACTVPYINELYLWRSNDSS